LIFCTLYTEPNPPCPSLLTSEKFSVARWMISKLYCKDSTLVISSSTDPPEAASRREKKTIELNQILMWRKLKQLLNWTKELNIQKSIFNSPGKNLLWNAKNNIQYIVQDLMGFQMNKKEKLCLTFNSLLISSFLKTCRSWW